MVTIALLTQKNVTMKLEITFAHLCILAMHVIYKVSNLSASMYLESQNSNSVVS